MPQSYLPRRPLEALEIEIRGLRHHVTRWAGLDPEPVFLLRLATDPSLTAPARRLPATHGSIRQGNPACLA